MLTEKRYRKILELVDLHQNVTVQELVRSLGVSESTIRRDLNALDKMGKLKKVFGGASAAGDVFLSRDLSMDEKALLNLAEKRVIAGYAANLVRPGDFIFVDAGTTTQVFAELLTVTDATYVTNSIGNGSILAAKGCRTIILGGELKSITEAIVGADTIESINKYHFTKGFFGTNGMDETCGFTTPDITEAAVKRVALERTEEKYILGDSSKFGKIAPVSFGAIDSAVILTDRIPDARYRKYENIREVGAL